MPCANCGSGALGMTDESGGVESGRFVEVYECETCGAVGRVRGEASAPASEWDRVGEAFGA